MFDLEEALKAVARVKDRSIGPETVHDLSALVDAAAKRVATLEGDLHAIETRSATEREQLTNKVRAADAKVLAAIQARDAAIETERQHSVIVALAVELDRTVLEIAAAQDELAAQKAAMQAHQADCARTLKASEDTVAVIVAERDAALLKDAAHQETLTKIADLAWWDRLRGVTLAREAVDGPH